MEQRCWSTWRTKAGYYKVLDHSVADAEKEGAIATCDGPAAGGFKVKLKADSCPHAERPTY